MNVVVSHTLPPPARDALSAHAHIIPFATHGITYPYLSGHADLFMVPGPTWVLAPNTPPHVVRQLRLHGVPLTYGTTPVDATLAGASAYNAAVHPHLLVANPDRLDPAVRHAYPDAPLIAVRQGLSRCTTLILDPTHVVTSDGGVHKALRRAGIDSLLVDSRPIRLPGCRNGCFGGCCGLHHGRLFIVGSLDAHPQGADIRRYVAHTHVTDIIELHQGPLTDVGSLMFF